MTIKTAYVDTVVVTDPDTGAMVTLEIRKQANGPMVGLDMVGNEDADYYSPYDKGALLDIPDDETQANHQ